MIAEPRRVRRVAVVALYAVLAASACGGSGDAPAAPAPSAVAVAAVTVRATTTSLTVGSSLKLSAAPTSAGGVVLSSRTVTWASSDGGVLTVAADGTVTAVAAGSAVVTATCEGQSGALTLTVTPNPVARVALSATALTLDVGETRTVAARLVDTTGADVPGEPVRWSTSDAAVATVSAAGAVQAVAPGSATVTAAASGRSATVAVTVRVPAVNDVAVVDAVWTQGVQTPDGAFPLVLGTPAALNVLLRGAGLPGGGPSALPGQLVLQLRDASGAVVRADTARPSFPSAGAVPSLAAPSAQFLLPAAALRAGLTWRVVRDPRGAASDDSASNDTFPRAGDAPLRTVELPTLKIRFVPITLSAHGGTTGAVSTATLEQYLQTVRSTFPAGRVDAAVLAPVTTGASFGAPPVGGATAFWVQALQDLDLAHVASGEADAYWYGVVRPPNGFTYTTYGGYGYIPDDPAATGPATRSALGVQVGWFNNPAQARDLVAHELAHNHGRRHAPCGTAEGLDPAFPFPSGTLAAGGVAHDVFSWAAGRTTGAAALAAGTGDLMSYCYPLWSSTYTYGALLAARRAQTTVAVAAARTAPERLLVVQGQIDEARVTLRPAVTIVARAPAASGGAYRLEGRDANGATLFARAFTPSAVDHAAARLFTVAVPLSDDAEARLAELVVTGPDGRAVRRRAPSRRTASPPVVRRSATAADARCGDPDAAAVVVTDAATGAVLASGPGAAVTVSGAPPAALRVACSDGVRTTARVVR